MKEHIAANGTAFSDEDLETWATQAEAGFPGAKFGTPTPGRPVTVGEDARPLTIRLDTARRAKLNKIAKEQNTTVSQLMRNLIDAI